MKKYKLTDDKQESMKVINLQCRNKLHEVSLQAISEIIKLTADQFEIDLYDMKILENKLKVENKSIEELIKLLASDVKEYDAQYASALRHDLKSYHLRHKLNLFHFCSAVLDRLRFFILEQEKIRNIGSDYFEKKPNFYSLDLFPDIDSINQVIGKNIVKSISNGDSDTAFILNFHSGCNRYQVEDSIDDIFFSKQPTRVPVVKYYGKLAMPIPKFLAKFFHDSLESNLKIILEKRRKEKGRNTLWGKTRKS